MFDNFLEDMGERPNGKTLDRINNDGHYEPGNCRWATLGEQMQNSKLAKLTPGLVQEIHGRCEHGESQLSVAKRMGVSLQTVWTIRVGRAWKGSL